MANRRGPMWPRAEIHAEREAAMRAAEDAELGRAVRAHQVIVARLCRTIALMVRRRAALAGGRRGLTGPRPRKLAA